MVVTEPLLEGLPSAEVDIVFEEDIGDEPPQETRLSRSDSETSATSQHQPVSHLIDCEWSTNTLSATSSTVSGPQTHCQPHSYLQHRHSRECICLCVFRIQIKSFELCGPCHACAEAQREPEVCLVVELNTPDI